jgi:hypothetical protein
VLDDLRRPNDVDDFDDQEDDDSFNFVEDDDEVSKRLFLGMTAVERMFLSLFLFMNVVVLGLAFLIVTGRMAF